MGLTPGTPLTDIAGRPRVHRLVHQQPARGPARRRARWRRAGAPWSRAGSCRAPGSIKQAAEAEGLDRVFREAGFEWREAGCSMCVGINGETGARGRARRLDVQPQLRGAPGPGRAHAPDEPGDGGGRRGDRPAHRRAHAGGLTTMEPFTRLTRRRRADRPAQRRHRPDHPRALPAQAARRAGLRRLPLPRRALRRRRRETPGVRAQPAGVPRRRGSSWPRRTSAAAPRARPRCGRSTAYGIRAVIAPSFGDIFYGNCFKNGVLPVVLPAETRGEPAPAAARASPAATHGRGPGGADGDRARRRRRIASRSIHSASRCC